MPATNISGRELRRVVLAASVGNIIEWYDFYIFGSLASILAVKFFEKSHPVAAFLSTVAIFSVGFLIRPLGAFVFGWLGDKVRRVPGAVDVRVQQPADLPKLRFTVDRSRAAELGLSERDVANSVMLSLSGGGQVSLVP